MNTPFVDELAPPWANYIATDKNGEICWYENEPVCGES